MVIQADETLYYAQLNERIRESADKEIVINGCIGQRYIGDGTGGKNITVNGTPGNALGAYLNGSDITVNGNAQDATGDTMNDGSIIIHGSCGDAAGYAMRGGKIYIKGNVGYRAGIHMKAYKEKQPILVIGGKAGSFLGEYQAGGTIIVLGLNTDAPIIGNFCGTGMHGGRMFLRCDSIPKKLPRQVKAQIADKEEISSIEPIIRDFCAKFGFDAEKTLNSRFFMLTPDSKNPYTQMFVHN